MFKRIVVSALVGGLLAGLFLTGLQMFKVVPLILLAETFESAGAHGTGDPDNHAAAHRAEVHNQERPSGTTNGSSGPAVPIRESHADWGGDDGLQRVARTAVANSLIAIGFGLLLAAVFSFRGSVGLGMGAVWGLAGYAVFFLLPSLGLPPELPGDFAPPLLDRQIWWSLTVVCSGVGLALALLRKEWRWRVSGTLLLLAPHLIGAPHLEVAGGSAPRELIETFYWATGLANAVFWLVLGAVTAVTYKKLG